MQKLVYKMGFTLAEVLVTLIVIGVIAALTIPALIQSINDAQLKTAWKEAYSIIDQATSRILDDNGGTLMNYFVDELDMANKYESYLSVSKKCDYDASFGNCFAPVGKIKYLNGQVLDSTQADNDFGLYVPGLVLNNGFYVLTMADPDCPVGAGNRRYCGWMAVDVNGAKSPNTIGKDIFRIWILDNGAIAQGAQDTNIEGDCDTIGWKCGALYLSQ